MPNVNRWTVHSPMSDSAGHAAVIAALPSSIGALNSIIQGILIHAESLAAYGLDDAAGSFSRTTLPIAERLDWIFEKDARHLLIQRLPGKRAVGTCRDFALMLCSFLRSKGVPARVRCGFAAYFINPWEDHWVCEYWDEQCQRWCLSDPQIDGWHKERFQIEFDPTDVPRQAFVTAGQAWLDCRAARSDPHHFGQGKVTGLWFIKVNVFRDHYVLNNRETSVWDSWRTAPLAKRVIGAHEVPLLDDLAARPEQPLVETVPDWLE
jgi:hypothetical protein